VKRILKIRLGHEGYALLAAMLITFLLTVLGLWAMWTSTSDVILTKNMNEDQFMFFYAEQAVDRIRSHLNYLEGGLYAKYKGLGYLGTVTTTTTTLDVIKILDSSSDVQSVWPIDIDPSNPIRFRKNQNYKIDAWLDPKDIDPKLYAAINDYPARLSNQILIHVQVTNVNTGYGANYVQGFEAKLAPKSVWDFAYFADNYQPDARTDNNCPLNTPNSWWNCHHVFLNNDVVAGDLFVGNKLSPTNPSRIIVRGGPNFVGEIRYRYPSVYSVLTSQTAGGASAPTTVRPTTGRGYQSNSQSISMPPFETVFDSGVNSFRKRADIVLQAPSSPDGKVWKILFRNDLATMEPNGHLYGGSTVFNTEEGFVASAITPSLNNGVPNGISKDPGGNTITDTTLSKGVMVIARIPFTSTTEHKKAYYGRMFKERVDKWNEGGGDVLWNFGSSWKDLVYDNSSTGGRCSGTRSDNSSSPTYKAYDPHDIDFDFIFVPDQGMTPTSAGGALVPNPRCKQPGKAWNGIIFVEGDVLVSGVLDGKVTIVAAGDIYLDHEVQYELDPIAAYGQGPAPNAVPGLFNDRDLLGLIAAGNIIIPNSCYGSGLVGEANKYSDDWSDAYNPAIVNSPFVGTGYYDGLKDDDGSEKVMAVMVSYGHKACVIDSSSITCPELNPNLVFDKLAIQYFMTGVYATHRNCTGGADGDPYTWGGAWSDDGNHSGPLNIVGAIIQNYSGRFAYDFFKSGSAYNSTCSDGVNGCHTIGHESVAITYDPHLTYTHIPMPRDSDATAGDDGKMPFGFASWEIVSWTKADPVGSFTNQW